MSIFIRTIAIPGYLASVGLPGRNDPYLAVSGSEYNDVDAASNGAGQFKPLLTVVLTSITKNATQWIGKCLGCVHEIEAAREYDDFLRARVALGREQVANGEVAPAAEVEARAEPIPEG
jgi:hypothetical protein